MDQLNIKNLIRRLKDGTISNPEISTLLEFLKSPEPGIEMESLLQSVWNESPDTNNEIDSRQIFNRILNDIPLIQSGDKDAETRSMQRLKIKKFLVHAMRYAAVFILAFAFFRLVQPVSRQQEQVVADQLHRVMVPYGSKTKVELPDGSVIILNSGSNLNYSNGGFNSGMRSVNLEGEGFFSVKEDRKRPFYVITRGMRVKVLGTTFNVKAYPEENMEEATLVTGSVEIYASSNTAETGRPVVLKPNETATFNIAESRISKQETEAAVNNTPEPVKLIELKTIKKQDYSKTEELISWKDNKLIFDNEPFSSLIIKLERWYDVSIKVDYHELNNARFSGKFDKETVEQVMHALSTITPFRFEIRKNQITIMKN